MSDPYQHPSYQPPKRLTRSTSDKFVGGVCGGVARYLNMDATLVRILTVILTLVTGGVPVIAYLIALFVMPEDTRVPPSVGPHAGPTPPQDDVWGATGPPWTSEQAPTSPVQDPPSGPDLRR